MKFLYILLVFLPITIIGAFAGFSDPLMFACSALAIIPLAFYRRYERLEEKIRLELQDRHLAAEA